MMQWLLNNIVMSLTLRRPVLIYLDKKTDELKEALEQKRKLGYAALDVME